MSGYLLDTNVISELIKPRPEPRVISWVAGMPEEILFLSVLTIGEIRKGIAAHRDATRRARLDRWLVADVVSRFHGRILPVDIAVADTWGRLAETVRRPLPVIDGLLAATALRHDLTFVSRNANDIADTGVAVLNPWDA